MFMFKLISDKKPTGDQPKAIDEIYSYLQKGHKYQTLWGVTGSGKTFTMANVIEKVQKPTLVIAHNKTLAAQLAQEFKEFFPDNAVHYFVSYYDYYQPEAYVQKTDTYIEKEATINEEIDRLRHAATQSLLTRKDVIIVASVSCIYGIGDIDAYIGFTFDIKVGEFYKIEDLLKNLVSMQFRRATSDFKPGTFHILGDILEIFPASEETIYTIQFWGDEITEITRRNYLTGEIYEYLQEVTIFPAKHTVTTKERINEIIPNIKAELDERLKYFKEEMGDILRYERLKTKVEYDIEMMQEVGYVNGIENYSRYLDGRQANLPPATLIDYFGDDYLCFIDESHMTVSQIGGMYAGDRSRKESLVNNGFRLPSALDNRPLKFDEFEQKMNQVVFVSATPGSFEIEKSSNDLLYFENFDPIIDGEWKSNEKNRVVSQVIRPTGLIDPEIEIKSMEFMIDDILKTLDYVIEKGERMLVTTITKRSSEELADYLLENGYKVRYLHSEIETLERLEILKMLRMGEIDVIVGVNLLREGLDLPEVSRIAILDADKQGFLRSKSSLIQIIGRAARNSNGKVIMYTEKFKGKLEENKSQMYALGNLYRLDKGKMVNDDGFVVSEAMKTAIDLTYYRRKVQTNYNEKHNITPTTILSSIKDIGINTKKKEYAFLDKQSIEKELKRLELEMDIASANLDFEKAADLRDMIIELRRGKKK
nr:excinuclease ABC subunit UvrB [Candidatus Gracilibacteria bacterium]